MMKKFLILLSFFVSVTVALFAHPSGVWAEGYGWTRDSSSPAACNLVKVVARDAQSGNLLTGSNIEKVEAVDAATNTVLETLSCANCFEVTSSCLTVPNVNLYVSISRSGYHFFYGLSPGLSFSGGPILITRDVYLTVESEPFNSRLVFPVPGFTWMNYDPSYVINHRPSYQGSKLGFILAVLDVVTKAYPVWKDYGFPPSYPPGEVTLPPQGLADGMYDYTVHAMDESNAWLAFPGRNNYGLDRVLPTSSCSVNPTGETFDNTLEVTLTESDDRSGINEGDVDLSINSGPWQDYASTINNFTYTATADNTYEFRYRVRDNAGNWNSFSSCGSTTVIVPKAKVEGVLFEDQDGDECKDPGETVPPAFTNPQVVNVMFGSSLCSIALDRSSFSCEFASGNPANLYVAPGGDLSPYTAWACAGDNSCSGDCTGLDSPPQTTLIRNLAFSIPAWFQTQGGDVHAEGILTSPVPETAQYFSLAQDDFEGVISAAGSANFSPGSASARGWKVENYSYNEYSLTNRYDYTYFLEKIKSPLPLGNFPNQSTLDDLDGFYQVMGDGNLTIPQNAGGNWTVGGGKSNTKVIVFVPGNLNIQGTIKVGANRNNFLAIFVKGNIFLNGNYVYDPSGASALEGIYLADGQIETGVNSDPTRVLLGKGVFVAHQGFNLQRALSDPSIPAEKFVYDPHLLMQAPKELTPPAFIWQEIAP